MREPCVPFDQFTADCESAGVAPVRLGDTHWRVIGQDRNGNKVLVDFWPTAKGGPKFLVVGRDPRALRGDHNEAIREATGRAAESAADEPTLLRRIAQMALEYMRFDGKLLGQMRAEQAHACVDLLAALRA